MKNLSSFELQIQELTDTFNLILSKQDDIREAIKDGASVGVIKSLTKDLKYNKKILKTLIARIDKISEAQEEVKHDADKGINAILKFWDDQGWPMNVKGPL